LSSERLSGLVLEQDLNMVGSTLDKRIVSIVRYERSFERDQEPERDLNFFVSRFLKALPPGKRYLRPSVRLAFP
jgi:hypothetical protein